MDDLLITAAYTSFSRTEQVVQKHCMQVFNIVDGAVYNVREGIWETSRYLKIQIFYQFLPPNVFLHVYQREHMHQ